MKIKNRELLNFVNSQLGNKRLPVKLMFAITANVEEAEGKIKAYEDSRKKLIDQYAKKDENGEPIVKGNSYVFEDQDKWTEVISDLLEMEVEMNMTVVSLDEVVKCDGAEFDSLTVNELSVIKFMIEK